MLVDIVDGKPVGYLPVREAALVNGVTESTILVWLKRDGVEPLKIGKRYFMPEGYAFSKTARSYRIRTDKAADDLVRLGIPDQNFSHYLSVSEYALRKDIERKTVYNNIYRGKLDGIQLGGKWFVYCPE